MGVSTKSAVLRDCVVGGYYQDYLVSSQSREELFDSLESVLHNVSDSSRADLENLITLPGFLHVLSEYIRWRGSSVAAVLDCENSAMEVLVRYEATRNLFKWFLFETGDGRNWLNALHQGKVKFIEPYLASLASENGGEEREVMLVPGTELSDAFETGFENQLSQHLGEDVQNVEGDIEERAVEEDNLDFLVDESQEQQHTTAPIEVQGEEESTRSFSNSLSDILLDLPPLGRVPSLGFPILGRMPSIDLFSSNFGFQVLSQPAQLSASSSTSVSSSSQYNLSGSTASNPYYHQDQMMHSGDQSTDIYFIPSPNTGYVEEAEQEERESLAGRKRHRYDRDRDSEDSGMDSDITNDFQSPRPLSSTQNDYPQQLQQSMIADYATQVAEPEEDENDDGEGMDKDGKNIESYIEFFRLVSTTLDFNAHRSLRYFKPVQDAIMKLKPWKRIPGYKNIKQKMKHAFNERRRREVLATWHQLENLKRQSQKELEQVLLSWFRVQDGFSENFRKALVSKVTEQLDKQAENAGNILDFDGPTRGIFVNEIVRLHREKFDERFLALWNTGFHKLFTFADIEMCVVWGCSCKQCLQSWPFKAPFFAKASLLNSSIKAVPGDDYVKFLTQGEKEEFKTEFTKSKASQYYVLLKRHKEGRTVDDLVGLMGNLPKFRGWDKTEFKAALAHIHPPASCKICKGNKRQRRKAGGSSSRRLAAESGDEETKLTVRRYFDEDESFASPKRMPEEGAQVRDEEDVWDDGDLGLLFLSVLQSLSSIRISDAYLD